MSFVTVGAVVSIAGGVAQAIDANVRRKKAQKEAEKAKLEYEQGKDAFRSLDTSNPYLNMENMYEDLTVNQQEAEFIKQQQMQQQSNVMQGLRGAAGGAGIASLAQAMVGEQNIAAQQAAVSIGQQERENMLLQAGEAANIQSLEREGEVYSRGLEFAKTEGLMNLAGTDMQLAQARGDAARSEMFGAIGQVGSGLMGLGGGGGGGSRRSTQGAGGPGTWERGDDPNAPYVGLTNRKRIIGPDNPSNPMYHWQ